jgi:hypothetical protein
MYNPQKAWLRAAVYFLVCFLIAGFSGTLTLIRQLNWVTAANLQDSSWVAWTLLCLGIILVGYGFIWPKGTVTHGRPLVWTAVLLFGLLWGISEGLLFASIWLIVFRIFGQTVWTVLLTFLILSAFLGLWHQFYWDVKVAPEHNVAEWNGRKVLFVHTPNLIATLTYLTLYQSIGIFVLLQTIALLLSTWFIHFPPFWQTDSGGS